MNRNQIQKMKNYLMLLNKKIKNIKKLKAIQS